MQKIRPHDIKGKGWDFRIANLNWRSRLFFTLVYKIPTIYLFDQNKLCVLTVKNYKKEY